MKSKRDALFDAYLSDEETLLWVGQPNPSWLLSPSDLYLIPFSLVWGGFTLFWETSVLSGKAPIFFPLWGLMFVIAGQYFIWGRFVHKYFKRRNTYYALTDRRALVLTRLFGTSLKAHFLHQIPSLQRQGQSVLFGGIDIVYRARGKQADLLGDLQPGFYALEDADDIYRTMQDLMMPDKAKNA